MNTGRLRTWALAAAIAALLGTSAESCGDSSTASGVPGCQATTVAPSWAKGYSTDGSGFQVKKTNPLLNTLVGTLWARCPVRPKAHVLELDIYWRSPESTGDLGKIASQTYKTIPGPDWTPYQVGHAFITGDFELRYTVFVTNAQGDVQPPESSQGYRHTFTIDDWKK